MTSIIMDARIFKYKKLNMVLDRNRNQEYDIDNALKTKEIRREYADS